MKVLPVSYLKCLSAADRKILGKAGILPSETAQKADARNERDLQRQIIALLRLKGIEINVSRMDKRKTDRVGWPDLTFAVIGYEKTGFSMPRIYACAWEVKMPGKHMDEAQRNMKKKLSSHPNHWTHRVIHSVDEALMELRTMGIE